MGEIVSINQIKKSPQQRAYEWARREMNMMFPEPDCANLLLGDRAEQYGTYISFFESEHHGDPAIYRIFWYSYNAAKYGIINNLAELKEAHPELVELYLKNGIYASEHG